MAKEKGGKPRSNGGNGKTNGTMAEKDVQQRVNSKETKGKQGKANQAKGSQNVTPAKKAVKGSGNERNGKANGSQQVKKTVHPKKLHKFDVHRSRQIEHMPSTITSIAYLGDLVAVARENGNIQIYYIREKGWFLERTIYGDPESSIEQIIWIDPLKAAERDANAANRDGIDSSDKNAGSDSEDDSDDESGVIKVSFAERKRILQRHVRGRLISVHLDGKVIEWDLHSGVTKSIMHTGGAIWSARLNEQQTILACGCEDGRVRFIDVTSPALDVIRTSEKGTSRALSIAWIDDEYIVVGGADSVIRKIHVGSGRFALKMDVGGSETVVWELQTFVNPETGTVGLVSGDSTGTVTWWDHQAGVPLSMMKSHEADVLTIGVSPNRIMSAGVDRKIVQYTLDGLHAGEKRYHTHDVRCLTYIPKPWDVLVSGGVDGTLSFVPVVDFPDCKISRLPTFPHNGIVSLSRNGSFTSIIDKEVQIWKTNTAEGQEPAKMIAKIVHHGLNVSAANISDNSERIAICDPKSIKLYSFINNRIKMIKSSDITSAGGALSCAFTADGLRLVVGTTSGEVKMLDTTTGELITTLKEHLSAVSAKGLPHGQWDYLRDIKISRDDQWLAVADVSSNIAVYSLDSLKLQTIVPTFNRPHTAIEFHEANLSTLIVALTNNVFHMYDVEEKKFTAWSRSNSNRLPYRMIQRKECIMGIASSSQNKDLVILYGASFVMFVDLSKPVGDRDCIISASRKRLIERALDGGSKPGGKRGREEDSTKKPDSKKRKQEPTNDDGEVDDELILDEESDSDLEDMRTVQRRPDGSLELGGTTVSEVFHMEHRWGPVMALRALSTGKKTAMVVIERPVLSVVSGLPGAFFRHQYGT